MRTTQGNMLLTKLVASSMEENTVNSGALSNMLESYSTEQPGMSAAVYSFIRKCGITKVSKRTLALADVAVKYFNNERIEMTDIEKLYISCPQCDEIMTYSGTEEEEVVYKCKVCGVLVNISIENAERYTSHEVYARGIYQEAYEPTESEQEWYNSEIGKERG